MAISLVGTYVSEDEQHILNITESVSSDGTFSGTFTTKNTPKGEIIYDINLGVVAGWRYTTNQTIAGLGFTVLQRPENWSFVLFDSWAGSITSEHQLIMSGSRSYTLPDGTQQVFSFENVKFTYSN